MPVGGTAVGLGTGSAVGLIGMPVGRMVSVGVGVGSCGGVGVGAVPPDALGSGAGMTPDG
jgi:hypothetical protein